MVQLKHDFKAVVDDPLSRFNSYMVQLKPMRVFF